MRNTFNYLQFSVKYAGTSHFALVTGRLKQRQKKKAQSNYVELHHIRLCLLANSHGFCGFQNF